MERRILEIFQKTTEFFAAKRKILIFLLFAYKTSSHAFIVTRDACSSRFFVRYRLIERKFLEIIQKITYLIWREKKNLNFCTTIACTRSRIENLSLRSTLSDIAWRASAVFFLKDFRKRFSTVRTYNVILRTVQQFLIIENYFLYTARLKVSKFFHISSAVTIIAFPE